MTHEDAGNYAAKRKGAQLNESIAVNIKERVSENKISCAEAHSIAVKLTVDPVDVGAAIDLLEIRISKCQMGLFGYGTKKNILKLSGPVDPEIQAAIRSSLVNDRITCSAAWTIAKKFRVSKSMVSAVCDTMKVKISACQLGAFR
ncbi:MAG TPA: hypothetical protein PK514_10955 [Spirochaetota bacterium]|nr:hypothetical protein [Spirochaetota bacterium]